MEHIGLSVNKGDTKYGATPLHYAANGGHVKVIKFILSKIDKINPDYDGATPLHEAAAQGHLTVSWLYSVKGYIAKYCGKYILRFFMLTLFTMSIALVVSCF